MAPSEKILNPFALLASFTLLAHGAVHANSFSPPSPEIQEIISSKRYLCERDLTHQGPVRPRLVKEINELLAKENEYPGLSVSPRLAMPIRALEIIKDRLLHRDREFRRLLQYAFEQKRTDHHELNLFLLWAVYPLPHFFNEDLDDVNIEFFLKGFERQINWTAEQLDLGRNNDNYDFYRHGQEEFFKDCRDWINSKLGPLRALVKEVSAHPELLQRRNEKIRWARRLVLFLQKSRFPMPSLEPEVFQLLETVDNWYPPLERETWVGAPAETPPPAPSRKLFLYSGVKGFFDRSKSTPPPPSPAAPVAEGPEKFKVYVEALRGVVSEFDPIWLFAQPAGYSGGKTALSEDVYGNQPLFKQLVTHGELPADFMDNYNWWKRGMPHLARITGETSRSQIQGLMAMRDLAWPSEAKGIWNPNPYLERMRAAQNSTYCGRPFRLEIMASRDGVHWHPFEFHRESDVWVRDRDVDQARLVKRCIQCHASAGNGKIPAGLLSPLPTKLQTEEDLRGVGYEPNWNDPRHDIQLIKKMLEF